MLDPAHWRQADLGDGPPLLVVVVDTEEEFPWQETVSRENVSTHAMAAQSRAHRIFEKYGIVPTYVIDFPVASQPDAYGPLKELHEGGQCRIGTHLHPWVNPPFEEEVNNRNSYPGNLPRAQEEAKLRRLTEEVGARFGIRPAIYKAGRYGVGPNTTGILAALGYRIDLSVVPRSDFRAEDGPDFRACSARPYWFGHPDILEIPLSVGYTGLMAALGWSGWSRISSPAGRALRLGALSSRLRLLERLILTPEGITHTEHRRLTRALLKTGHRVFSFTYHSPSLEPGCTPYVRNDADLAVFLDRMDRYFDWFINSLGGTAATPEEILAIASERRQASRGAAEVSRRAS